MIANGFVFEPRFFCDVCKKRIDYAPMGMVVYFGEPISTESVETFHVHKLECDQRLRSEHAMEGRFQELYYHVSLLFNDLGGERIKALRDQNRQRLTELGVTSEDAKR
jgi:hypothetical protein